MTENNKAKEYSRTKQKLSLVHIAFTIAVLLIPVITPLSFVFKQFAESFTSNALLVVFLYFLFYSLYTFVIDLPFGYYSGFVLEHRYQLSNQKFGQWVFETLKRSGMSFLFSACLVLGLYAIIWNFPENWWVIAWAAFALVSYVMGKLFPVLIVPMFYKYGKVEDEALCERIIALAKRYGMPVENLYSINLSKTTKKANAAFMGMGKTKRVVLSDTLLENFTHDEIETVMAHELGHFKHHDIWKQLAFGLVTSFIGFWLVSNLIESVSVFFSYGSVADVATLPILFLIFYLFSMVMMPLQNGFSRVAERGADRFSLEAYPHPETFISCMEKLARVNLADTEPNPVYEWFFYNHPAIAKRIQMARDWQANKA